MGEEKGIEKEALILECLAKGLPCAYIEKGSFYSVDGLGGERAAIHHTSVLRDLPVKPGLVVYSSLFAKEQVFLQSVSEVRTEWVE